MFHADGDGEWLYNIPGRSVFGWVGAIFFWLGILIATYYALMGVIRSAYRVLRKKSINHASRITHHALASAFLIAWWLAGISPGFVSVPPASLGHTILAQSVVFMIAALPVWRLASVGREIGDWRLPRDNQSPISNLQSLLAIIFSIILLLSIAIRDIPDYFCGMA